jgi:hypothetical protein
MTRSAQRRRAVIYITWVAHPFDIDECISSLQRYVVDQGNDLGVAFVEKPCEDRLLRALLRRAAAGGFDVVAVCSLGELGASWVRAAQVIQDLHALGVEVLLEGVGPIGPTHPQVTALLGHQQRLSQASAQALAAKRARGEVTGQIPRGFRRAPDGVHLEPDPVEQAMLAQVRSLLDAGWSVSEIAHELNRQGFRSKVGTYLSERQVRRMLH